MSDNEQAILMIVQQVPEGRVATYGQVARLAGIPKNSRQVGSVLGAMTSGSEVPWFRIINSQGRISDRGRPEMEAYQREQLENESVEFGPSGKIDLAKFGWQK